MDHRHIYTSVIGCADVLGAGEAGQTGHRERAAHDDQPDSIQIGPVGPIPVHYEDDPRDEGDRDAWSNAAKTRSSLFLAG